MGETNIFSPSGTKIFYPTNKKDKHIVNNTGGWYLDQSYDLAIYDLTTNQAKVLTKEDKYKTKEVHPDQYKTMLNHVFQKYASAQTHQRNIKK